MNKFNSNNNFNSSNCRFGNDSRKENRIDSVYESNCICLEQTEICCILQDHHTNPNINNFLLQNPDYMEPEIKEEMIDEPELIEPELIEPEFIEPEIIEPEIIEEVIKEQVIIEAEIIKPEIEQIEIETVMEPYPNITIEIEKLDLEKIKPERQELNLNDFENAEINERVKQRLTSRFLNLKI